MGKSTRWLWWPGLTLVVLLSTGFLCSAGSILSEFNQPVPTEITIDTEIASDSPTETQSSTASTVPENPTIDPIDVGSSVTATIEIITSTVETEIVPQEVASPKPVFAMQYVPIDDLKVVKTLGTNVVLQNFRDFEEPEDWLVYLDAAHSYEIQVIAWYWEPGWVLDEETEEWIIDEKAVLFLETVRDHPALFAIYMVHEPYCNGCVECGYTTAQLQALYQQIKAIADVPLYAALGGLADWATESDEKVFADGVCDYCDLWYYPFRDGGVYNIEKTISVIEKEIGFAREMAPNSKIIWAMQAFEQGPPVNDVRMWTEDEIRHLAALVYEADIYGISWYTWQFGDLYSDFLSKHPEYYPVVKEIADQYVTGELETKGIDVDAESAPNAQ